MTTEAAIPVGFMDSAEVLQEALDRQVIVAKEALQEWILVDGSYFTPFQNQTMVFLGGGFKDCLFSPRKLGKMNPF